MTPRNPTVRRGGTLACVACVALAACDRAEPEPEPPPVNEVAEEAPAAVEEPVEALAPSGESVFGMSTPTGLTPDEVGAHFGHYRVDTSYDELVAFYSDELEDFERTVYDQGVKYEAPDDSSRSVYVYRPRRGDDGVLVTYFERPAASGAASAAGSGGDPGGTAPTGASDPGATGSPAGASATGGTADTLLAADGDSRSPGVEGASTAPGTVTRRIHRPPGGRSLPRDASVDPSRRPLDFVRGSSYEPPRNPNAYY